MTLTVLIPARLASTRLPNKPLADIAGLPMVVRVARRVREGGHLPPDTRVVVAADSVQIIDACNTHQVEAVLTRTDHASGSDRLAEACTLLNLADDAVVVNVQGDEPLIDPALVSSVARLLQANTAASMATAAHPIDTLEEFNNPNVVKVVLDAKQMALYFSRAPIAHARDHGGQAWWQGDQPTSPALRHARPLRHIGIYAYRAAFVRLFPTLAQAPLELAEALEQLRAMWHGHRIAVHISESAPGAGVDTPEDLVRVRRLFGH